MIVAFWRVVGGACVVGVGLFVVYTSLRAISESWNNDNFPEALGVKLELLPVIFPLHMISGGLALLLVPLTIALRHTPWHKLAGRVAGIDVLIAGLTAIPVALEAPVTLLSAAGFTAQGCVWLALVVHGWWNIRHGKAAAHARAMLLVAAVTSGAVFFRIYLGLWARFGVHGYFKAFYACDAWAAWGLPLLAMALLTRSTRTKNRVESKGISA